MDLAEGGEGARGGEAEEGKREGEGGGESRYAARHAACRRADGYTDEGADAHSAALCAAQGTPQDMMPIAYHR